MAGGAAPKHRRDLALDHVEQPRGQLSPRSRGTSEGSLDQPLVRCVVRHRRVIPKPIDLGEHVRGAPRPQRENSAAPVIARSVTGKGVGKMTKTKRTTLLLSLVSALLGASASVVLANSAVASELLYGEYIVAQSTSVPTAAHIAITATKNGQTGTQNIRCWLPNGVDSQNCWSAQLELALPVELVEENAATGRIEIDYIPLDLHLAEHGYDVIDIAPALPDIISAEGYWEEDWVTHIWMCSTEQSDANRCNNYCGSGGGTVSAEPLTPSTNAAYEPECEVTCDCANVNLENDVWIDPPEVLPG
jgi:hypothetical protein